jgi:hypothetical protein
MHRRVKTPLQANAMLRRIHLSPCRISKRLIPSDGGQNFGHGQARNAIAGDSCMNHRYIRIQWFQVHSYGQPSTIRGKGYFAGSGKQSPPSLATSGARRIAWDHLCMARVTVADNKTPDMKTRVQEIMRFGRHL